MFFNNVRVSVLVSLSIITSELHAIIVSCNFMFVTIFVLVYDTGDTINTVFTINASFTFFNSNISSCIFTIFSSRASQTNVTYTIFTRNGYSIFTIFTRDTNFTIDTICTRNTCCTSCTLWSKDSDTIFTWLAIFAINNYLI